jgi:hypothetical protein
MRDGGTGLGPAGAVLGATRGGNIRTRDASLYRTLDTRRPDHLYDGCRDPWWKITGDAYARAMSLNAGSYGHRQSRRPLPRLELDERERVLLETLYYGGRPLAEIAEVMGLHLRCLQSRVRILMKRGELGPRPRAKRRAYRREGTYQHWMVLA